MFRKQRIVNQVDDLVGRQADVEFFSLFKGGFLGFGSAVFFL